ncbi:MAG: hypothetical protein HY304_03260 [candidate division Zixibacteria bacterium]|nr:hypothetical protein [candidate division Zixibacteria bacterium]
MGRINAGRVIMGGLLAGLVMNLGEFILNGVVLKAQWETAMHAINRTPAGGSAIAVLVIDGFISGLLAIWLYAAVRPRLGSGPKTAVLVGLIVWIFSCFMALMPPFLTGILPGQIVATMVIWDLIEIPLGVVIGAWAYKE